MLRSRNRARRHARHTLPTRAVVAVTVLSIALIATAVGALSATRVHTADASPASSASSTASTARVTAASIVTSSANLAAPVVGLAATPSGKGFWRAAADGGVLTAGDAHFYGSATGFAHTKIVAIAATRSGHGYWLTDTSGDVFAFGDAAFHGSMGGHALNRPIVGMAATPDGSGYWLVAGDGGIFAFHAPFRGSTGAMRLNQPVVGMSPIPTGSGYWLVAADGGIFAFRAPFRGSMGAVRLNRPVVGMAAAPGGNGYTMVGADGGLFRFGTNSPFYGSAVNACPGAPAVAVATSRGATGYWIAFADGRTYAFSPRTAAPKCNPTDPASTPGPGNTGVPAGTRLTAYTGPRTITSCGVVIDRKIIPGDLDIEAGNGTHSAATPCVTITNSRVDGAVHDSYTGRGRGPVVLRDTEIAVPMPNDGASAGLDESNFYGWRLNVHGARSDVQCDGYCELHDSWIHGNYYVSPAHLDAFITNGNYGHPIVLDHNTFLCQVLNPTPVTDGSGCAADVGLFADFSPITNITMTNNVFRANPADLYFCLYTGAHQPSKPYPVGSNLVFMGNVFEAGSSGKCGAAGATQDWSEGAGNVWAHNIWSTGAPTIP
jgi:hypothetical protein